MKKLGSKIIHTTRSGSYQYALVESVNKGLVTVKLGTDGSGMRLTNLNVVGTVEEGDLAVVDYSAGVPYVRAISQPEPEIEELELSLPPLEIDLPTESIFMSPCAMPDGTACGTLAYISGVGFGIPAYISGSCSVSAASAATIATAKVIGIGAGGGRVLLDGFIKNSAWSMSPGLYVFLAVGGGISHSKPTLTDQCVTVLGVAVTSSVLRFKPELVVVELL
jgi:hypothetical protein